MSRVSIIALVAFVVLTALVLVMKAPAARRLQRGAMELVRPLHTSTSGMRRFNAAVKGLESLDQLESDKKNLTIENQQLRATNQMMNDLQTENNRLRQALDFRDRSKYELIPARIIARSSTSWWSTVQIDRGEQDKLDTDMPVVTDVGLVGKTTTVAGNTAFVLLISDENCKVFAKVEGTREKGILSGERTAPNAQPELSLSFLSKGAQLQPGMKVFSNGVSGGVFPGDLLLGTIKNFQVRELDVHATVLPAVDLSKLENVFVVKGFQHAAAPPPTAAPKR